MALDPGPVRFEPTYLVLVVPPRCRILQVLDNHVEIKLSSTALAKELFGGGAVEGVGTDAGTRNPTLCLKVLKP